MQDPENPDEAEELDNLLSDQYLALGRARDLLDKYSEVCQVETKILLETPAVPAKKID